MRILKIIFKVLLIVVVATFLILSFIGIDKKADNRLCEGMELDVEDSLSLGLISKKDVLSIIQNKKMKFEGKKITDINMGNIERTLSQSPYIDTVICSLTASGKIHLSVIPKIPALHVIADNGEEYYLDRRGSNMPIGEITSNLSIATGKITKSYAKKCLTELACCIQDSAFWRAQVQQIEVVNAHDVRLYTRISDHVIMLGDPTNIPDKLWRVRVFYEKGLKEIGWNKYESINVAYDNIIIGKKREK